MWSIDGGVSSAQLTFEITAACVCNGETRQNSASCLSPISYRVSTIVCAGNGERIGMAEFK